MAGIPGLEQLLAGRKRYVDEVAESSEGFGAGGAISSQAGVGSRFAGTTFVDKSRTGYVGLINQGATCYLNSMLQSMFMLPEFRRAIFAWRYNEEAHGESKRCLALQLQKLFASLHLSERGAVSTAGLTRSFGWEGREAFVQHDVLECLMHILEHLEVAAAGTTLGTFYRRHMRGEEQRFVRCHTCGNESIRSEPFVSITTAVRDMRNLEHSLASYMGTETLEGDNQYACSACGNKSDATMGVRLSKIPSIFVIQLNRFELDYATLTRRKVNDELPFPQELDMAAVQASGAGAASAPGPADPFDLVGVLMHTGSAHGGHYFAYVREMVERPRGEEVEQKAEEEEEEEEGGAGGGEVVEEEGATAAASSVPATPWGRWLHFNDSTVRAMTEKGVRRALGVQEDEPAPGDAAAASEDAGKPAPKAGSDEAPADASSGAGESRGSKQIKKAKKKSKGGGGGSGRKPLIRSSTNAYMLVYRRRAAAAQDELLSPAEAQAAIETPDAVPPIPADAVPENLREEIAADNVKYRALKREWDWERQLVRCQVYAPDQTSASVAGGAGKVAAAVAAASGSSVGDKPARKQLVEVAMHGSRSTDELVVEAAIKLGLAAPAARVAGRGEDLHMPGSRGDAKKAPAVAAAQAATAAEAAEPAAPPAVPPRFSTAEEVLAHCRLRRFDPLRCVRLAPLEQPARDDNRTTGEAADPAAPLLRAVKPRIERQRPLILEVRGSASEAWPGWQDQGLPLRLLVVDPESGQYQAPAQVNVAGTTVEQLGKAVEDHTGWHGACRIVVLVVDEAIVVWPPTAVAARRPMGGAAAVLRAEGGEGAEEAAAAAASEVEATAASGEIRPTTLLTGSALKLDMGSVVYAEHCPPEDVTKPSPVQQRLEAMANTVAMRFNLPTTPPGLIVDAPAAAAGPEVGRRVPHLEPAGEAALTAEEDEVLIDQRAPLSALRAAIAEKLGRAPGSFKILRSSEGPELKDGDQTLAFFGYVEGGRVTLIEGQPMQPEEVSLKILFHDDEAAELAAAAQAKASAGRGGRGRGRGGGRGRGAGGGRGGRGGGRGGKTAGTAAGAAAPSRDVFRDMGRVEVPAAIEVLALKGVLARLFDGHADCPGADRMRLRERTAQKLTGVLPDALPLGKALTTRKVADGKEIVIQRSRNAGEVFSAGDVLLTFRHWNPLSRELGPPVERVLPGATTVQQLKESLAADEATPWAAPLGLEPAAAPEAEAGAEAEADAEAAASGPAAAEAGADAEAAASGPAAAEAGADAEAAASGPAAAEAGPRPVLLCKALTWQLRDIPHINELRSWGKQPAAKATLLGKSLRLSHGNTILFCDGRRMREEQERLKRLRAGDEAPKPQPVAHRADEPAFRIFTPEEQRRREEARKRQEAEKEQEAVDLGEVYVTPLVTVDGIDISIYKKLLAMNMPMELVRAKMRQEGVDPKLLERRPPEEQEQEQEQEAAAEEDDPGAGAEAAGES